MTNSLKSVNLPPLTLSELKNQKEQGWRVMPIGSSAEQYLIVNLLDIFDDPSLITLIQVEAFNKFIINNPGIFQKNYTSGGNVFYASLDSINSLGFLTIFNYLYHHEKDLLKNLISDNDNSKAKKNPLHMFCSRKFDEIPSKLSTVLKLGFTKKEIVEYLNEQDAEGHSPLHLCILKNRTKDLAVLLKYHPNLSIKNNFNLTVFDIARKQQSNECLNILNAYAEHHKLNKQDNHLVKKAFRKHKIL